MTEFKVELSRNAAKFLRKIKNPIRSRLISALELLAEEPDQGKPLVGPLKGKRSWRVGNYRIIYEVVKERITIFVISIGHRKDVYS